MGRRTIVVMQRCPADSKDLKEVIGDELYVGNSLDDALQVINSFYDVDLRLFIFSGEGTFVHSPSELCVEINDYRAGKRGKRETTKKRVIRERCSRAPFPTFCLEYLTGAAVNPEHK